VTKINYKCSGAKKHTTTSASPYRKTNNLGFGIFLPCIIIHLNHRIMQAQLITYQLKDISQVDYLKQMVEPDAPILANVKGLISKVWLTDEAKNTFGGFYLWEDKTAMENFMHSDLVKVIVSRPYVTNVSSVDYEVNQSASKITRGIK